jgi:uncharacterized protein (DUF2249 family)
MFRLAGLAIYFYHTLEIMSGEASGSGGPNEGGAMEVLDVRPLPPRERHDTIFGRLDALTAGQTLRLVNDHDPVPLRYQLEATRPGEFHWVPVEAGPEQWQIDITSRARVVDARPLLARGEEPFETIMAVVADLGDDEILVVRAPFEPVPLEGVLAEQGFAYVVDELGEDDWRVVFVRR